MLGMRKRFTAAAAALLMMVALVVAGCGSASSSNASAAGGAGATIAPASALAFVSIVTDQSSSQWQTADSLLSKFPGKQQLLDSIKQSVAKSGVDVNGLLSALGPELDLVVLADGSSTQTVGLAKPSDPATLDAALAKGSSPAVHTTVDGWTVFSDKQAALDAFTAAAANGKLADDSTYQTAVAKLSGDALVKAYVNGAQAEQALQSSSLKQLQQLAGGGGTLVSAAAEVVATSSGIKIDGTATTQGGTTLAPMSSDLLDQAPSGALAVLAFNGKGITDKLQSTPGGSGSLQQVLSVLQQVSGLLSGDNLLYVRGGGLLIPEITLLTTPSSASDGVATLDQLLAGLGGLGVQVQPKSVTIGSIQAKELNLGQFSIFYGADGKHLVVTDTQQGFNRTANGKLADDPNFKQAKSDSGLPDQTSGLLYVDLKDAVPLIESLAQLGGSSLSTAVQANLKPLRSLTAWTTSSGDSTSFDAFVGIQ